MSRRPRPAVSPEEVRRLASLSRLSVTRAEEARLKEELSTILEYFRTVDGTRGSDSPAVPSVEPSELRRDEARPSDGEGVLKGVPRKKGRLVRAPRVF